MFWPALARSKPTFLENSQIKESGFARKREALNFTYICPFHFWDQYWVLRPETSHKCTLAPQDLFDTGPGGTRYIYTERFGIFLWKITEILPKFRPPFWLVLWDGLAPIENEADPIPLAGARIRPGIWLVGVLKVCFTKSTIIWNFIHILDYNWVQNIKFVFKIRSAQGLTLLAAESSNFWEKLPWLLWFLGPITGDLSSTCLATLRNEGSCETVDNRRTCHLC